MHVIAQGHTDVGRVRTNNEDFFQLDPERHVYLVCDGMGGHEAGEVASELCGLTITRYVEDHEEELHLYLRGELPGERDRVQALLAEAVQAACADIYAAAESEDGHRGMGCTCTALLLLGRHAFMAHVGDSRCYMLRRERVYQLSQDHTLLQEEIAAGLLSPEDAEQFPHKNVLTRAVGVMPQVQVDTLVVELMEGDRFLLCSDGLTAYMGGLELGGYLREMKDINTLPPMLCEIACDRGGRDNVSVVTVEVQDIDRGDDEPEAGLKLSRLAETTLFRSLDYAELIRALNLTRVHRVKSGDFVVKEGEEGDAMFVLVEGSCEVSAGGVALRCLGPGEHFGEMALIDSAPRSASVQAVESSRLLRIGRDALERLQQTDPRLSAKILSALATTLAERLRETNRALAESHKQLARLTVP